MIKERFSHFAIVITAFVSVASLFVYEMGGFKSITFGGVLILLCSYFASSIFIYMYIYA